MTETTASRYRKLEFDRQPFLIRGRSASKLTIPTLLPPEGHSASASLPTPFQSVGARGVNTLSAKALTALFPPNEAFFRLDIEEFTLAEMSGNEKVVSEVKAALAMIERTTARAVEGMNIRPPAHEGLMHLVVAGNALFYVPPKGQPKVFPLDRYVCVRDPDGSPIEIIALEKVARANLSPEIIAELDTQRQGKPTQTSPGEFEDLYTHLTRESPIKWSVVQSVNDTIIEGTRGTYKHETCPWIPLRWNRVSGESYGRGHVEMYMGDLLTLESLSKAITEFAAGAAKVIALVNPSGVTDETDLANAENFEFVSGDANDVSFLRIDKYADLQVAKGLADDLTRRLEMAFLQNSSIQRAGERVTAEEIRFMAQDIEATVGGVYALLSQELQLPLVVILLAQLTKQKRLPPLPKGLVTPTVTTGLDALSRANDLNKLDRLAAGLRDLYGPEALAAETNVGEYVKRRAAALGIDSSGLIKSDEQKAAEAQQRQMQEAMMQMGPNAINAMGGMAKEAMKQDAP